MAQWYIGCEMHIYLALFEIGKSKYRYWLIIYRYGLTLIRVPGAF